MPAYCEKSMITSARSATPSATAGTWTGLGSRLPSFEICQNGCGVVRALQVRQVDLQEARRAGVDPAEAIAARADVQHRLDHAVDQELVAEDAVGVERVEDQIAGRRVEAAVGEHHRDVILRERRQAEAGRLVAGVVIVEEEVVTDQPLVDVLRREVLAVVVIPERAQRLVDVAVGRRGGEEAGELVRIVLVVVLAAAK